MENQITKAASFIWLMSLRMTWRNYWKMDLWLHFRERILEKREGGAHTSEKLLPTMESILVLYRCIANYFKTKWFEQRYTFIISHNFCVSGIQEPSIRLGRSSLGCLRRSWSRYWQVLLSFKWLEWGWRIHFQKDSVTQLESWCCLLAGCGVLQMAFNMAAGFPQSRWSMKSRHK